MYHRYYLAGVAGLKIISTLCMLGNFVCLFLLSADFYQKQLFTKN